MSLVWKTKFLLENEFSRGGVKKFFFTKAFPQDILIVRVYVDSIIFGATDISLCQDFSKVDVGEVWNEHDRRDKFLSGTSY